MDKSSRIHGILQQNARIHGGRSNWHILQFLRWLRKIKTLPLIYTYIHTYTHKEFFV